MMSYRGSKDCKPKSLMKQFEIDINHWNSETINKSNNGVSFVSLKSGWSFNLFQYSYSHRIVYLNLPESTLVISFVNIYFPNKKCRYSNFILCFIDSFQSNNDTDRVFSDLLTILPLPANFFQSWSLNSCPFLTSFLSYGISWNYLVFTILFQHQILYEIS